MGEISEKAFPFDSEPDNLGNNDREYFANDFTRYFKEFISSGLFMKRADSLQVIANGDMTVTLRPGNLIIDGYRYENLNDIIIPIEPADGVLNRIDRVSVTWIKEERDIHKTVQKGTQSYLPVAPECRRTEEYKDYVVADIYIPAGSIKITQDNITDQRLNSEICGLAIAFSEIDTKLIFDQLQAFYEKVVEENRAWEEGKKQEFDEWFQNAKDQLAGDVAGNLQKQIGTLSNLLTENKENLVGAVNEVKESIRAPVAHLLATEEGSPLDATMGTALKGEIDEVKEEVSQLNGNLSKIESEIFTFQNFGVKPGFVRLGTLPAEFKSRNITGHFITSSVNLPGPVTITIEHGNELYIYSSVNATVSNLSLKISYTDK